jgi:hypothetical protein
MSFARQPEDGVTRTGRDRRGQLTLRDGVGLVTTRRIDYFLAYMLISGHDRKIVMVTCEDSHKPAGQGCSHISKQYSRQSQLGQEVTIFVTVTSPPDSIRSLTLRYQ